MYTKSELEANLPWEETTSWRRVEVPDEWLDIVGRLDADLRTIYPEYRLLQVKEKFGGLRYYTAYLGDDSVLPAFYARIRQAEREAAEV